MRQIHLVISGPTAELVAERGREQLVREQTSRIDEEFVFFAQWYLTEEESAGPWEGRVEWVSPSGVVRAEIDHGIPAGNRMVWWFLRVPELPLGEEGLFELRAYLRPAWASDWGAPMKVCPIEVSVRFEPADTEGEV